ncbi:monooxygenase [Streptomyces albiaxialis]|uniref:Monooxygenase n=1 Tax=Streptomyces albiaxialis TaxID=329523 RepID=A0ABP5HJL6_9ACTN
MEQQSVVIAGGGPTGMWLACELRLAGVGVVVLERAPEIDPHSRALTVHPRTIETFALRGAHTRMLAEGGRISSGHFAVLDDRLDFGSLDTDFPFTLTIPQARTTELLQERALALGAEVRRGHRVTDAVSAPDSVSLTVLAPDGRTYALDAPYAVGCDGTRSVVRQCADIAFEGTSFTALGTLGDVVLDEPPPGAVVSAWTRRGTLMLVPLPGGLHRIAMHSPEDIREDWPGELTFEDFRERVRAVTGTDYGMHSPSWLSRFGNTSRLARSYRAGRILLAGDAAHQHMPAGGVGLNVGVQDAMNLGWKLAAVVTGRAPDALLDTYHAERHPVGADTIEHTQAQTALMMGFSPQGSALRSLMGKLIAERPQLRDALAERLSGLSVAYDLPGATHPLAGRRAPNLLLADSRHLYDLLADGRPVLVGSPRTSDGRLAPQQPQHRPAWDGVGAALIRPDGYVGWASGTTDSAALAREAEHALAALHGTPPERHPA